jgi:hypothetical protein
MASSCEYCSEHSTLMIFEKIHWLAEKILASQESLCGMEWGSHLRKNVSAINKNWLTDV